MASRKGIGVLIPAEVQIVRGMTVPRWSKRIHRRLRWPFWLVFAVLVIGCSGPAQTIVPSPVSTPVETDPPTAVSPSLEPSSPDLPESDRIQVPAACDSVTLPLHVLANIGEPGDQVTAVLRWQDGSERSSAFTVLAGEHGQGLVIGSLSWRFDDPPQPPTQSAILSLRDATNRVLAEQPVTVLSPNDSATREIQLYWTVPGTELVQPETRRIVQTERIGDAALRELLWGPPPMSQNGFETALPTPEEVLRFPGRQQDWGSRVTLLGLTIEDGLATADFSKEMRTYGGGSLRVKLIHDQISQTLRQFPAVREVRIAIEGQTEGVLEP